LAVPPVPEPGMRWTGVRTQIRLELFGVHAALLVPDSP